MQEKVWEVKQGRVELDAQGRAGFEEVEFMLPVGHKSTEVYHTIGYTGFSLELRTYTREMELQGHK